MELKSHDAVLGAIVSSVETVDRHLAQLYKQREEDMAKIQRLEAKLLKADGGAVVIEELRNKIRNLELGKAYWRDRYAGGGVTSQIHKDNIGYSLDDIRTLESNLNAAMVKVKNLEAEVAGRVTTIEGLQSTLNSREAKIASQAVVIKDSQREIVRLASTITQIQAEGRGSRLDPTLAVNYPNPGDEESRIKTLEARLEAFAEYVNQGQWFYLFLYLNRRHQPHDDFRCSC